MILNIDDKMQNPNQSGEDDKFAMNFGNFDSNGMFNAAHMGGFNIGMKRSAHDAGLDRDMNVGTEDDVYIKKEGKIRASSSRDNSMQHTSIEQQDLHHSQQKSLLPNGKKTKGRVKIKMEFIDNKLRRYTTFSKRKTGIMKKAYELSTLTGTQVMLLVASETGHVYTFATRKLQPMITSEAGKALIQTCLNSPDPPQVSTSNHHLDQRMSATGYEETELSYAVNEEEHKSPGFFEDYANGSSCSGSESSSPPTPCMSPAHTPNSPHTSSSLPSSSNSIVSTGSPHGGGLPLHLGSGLVLTPTTSECVENTADGAIFTLSGMNDSSASTLPVTLRTIPVVSSVIATSPKPVESGEMEGRPIAVISNNLATKITFKKPPSMSGGSMVVGNSGSGLIYSPGSNVVYAPSQDGSAPILFNLPPGLQITQEQGSGRKPQMMSLPISMASAVVAASNSYLSSQSNQSLPTDLSLHIKRETNS